MKSAFDDITLEWAGQAYTLPANRVLGAIARIEDIVTLSELQVFWKRKTAPMAKIAQAYGAVLRYVGAKVTDDEIYHGMLGGTQDKADVMVNSVSTLISMMLPPLDKSAKKDASQGNAVPAASASSKKPSKPRSARGE